MEFKNIFNQKPKETTGSVEEFLAIEIRGSQVSTAVWNIQQQQPKVINFGTSTSWQDKESLLLAIDDSLSNLLQDHTIQPEKTLLGLPETWVKGQDISPEKEPCLKHFIQKLKLKPIGFVVTTEAIIQQLKINEGIPPSLILLELAETKVNVIVVKLGQVVGRQEVGRSTDLGQDVEEGLARIEVKQLPSRMLIVDGQDSDAIQQLSSFPWQDKFPFLHLPKIENTPPHFSLQAIALAGGTEAARSLGFKISATETEVKPTYQPPTSSTQNHGFITGNIAQNKPRQKQKTTLSPPTTSPKNKNQLLKKARQFLSNISLPRFTFPSSYFKNLSLNKSWLLAIPAFLVVITLAFYLIYLKLSTARITVFIKPKQITHSFTIAIDDQDQDISTLKANSQKITLKDEAEISTSGETTIGNPASGKVTIYNKTNSPKNLKQGTIFTTSDNLKFTLEESLEVASQSASTDENEVTTLIPGKIKAPLVAQTIGESGNITADTELSVGTYPKTSLLAKVDQGFVGGSSQTVRSPSLADQEKLIKTVTQKIIDQSDQEIEQPDADKTTIPVSEPKIVSTEYNAEPGEQADQLQLKLTAEFTLLTYQNDHLAELIQEQLNEKIASGWKLNPDNTQTEFISLEANQDYLTAIVKVQASTFPQVPLEDYQKQLTKMPIKQAQSLLENIAGFQKSQIRLDPNLPLLNNRLPPNAKKIHIQLKALND